MADAFTVAILQALAESSEPVSLPRLGKRLGLGASVLLRRLHLMSEATIGGQPGPDWLRVESLDGRWMVHLTEAGRRTLPSLKEPDADT
ncbi:hypothetical protein RD110_07695 [Rhodoferax koreense]|uniref:HTH iclR-type domain-containing protein n=1 Tax=Rhodoferax koreensis TaxID=1842727 RepID=A0A1P8JTJ7_9BURK|nr:hypothetical protein [Rhodoferax koreense]APW37092.1 hypothetical protein RD110_07695 [Rhodoferax koreense]